MKRKLSSLRFIHKFTYFPAQSKWTAFPVRMKSVNSGYVHFKLLKLTFSPFNYVSLLRIFFLLYQTKIWTWQQEKFCNLSGNSPDILKICHHFSDGSNKSRNICHCYVTRTEPWLKSWEITSGERPPSWNKMSVVQPVKSTNSLHDNFRKLCGGHCL